MESLRDELLELLGPEGLAALSAARGGRRVYIPRMITPAHWLVEAVGLEAAKLLVFHFGGCRICVPRKPPPEARDACVRELRRAGRSVAKIASYTGLSERWVYKILARDR